MERPSQQEADGARDFGPLCDRFDIAYVIRKHFRRLIAIPVAFVGIALAVYLFKQPLFESSALVYIDPEFDQIIQFEQIDEGGRSDADSLSSLQVAIMADSMVLRVVESLGLREQDGFLPSGLAGKPDLPDLQLVRFLQKERFDAELIEGTRLIRISVLDPEADRARLIADAFASEFEEFLIEQRQDEARRALSQLESQAVAARDAAQQTEARLRAFREAHPQFPVEQDHDLFAKRLTQFSDELNAVVRQRMELASQEEILANVEAETSPLVVVELAGYQNMAHVSDLLSNRANAEVRLAAARQQWVPTDRSYKAAVAEFEGYDEKLRELARGIERAIRSKYASVRAREAALRAQVETLQQGLVEMKSLSSEFRALQQQVEKDWLVHETLQKKLGESVVASDAYSNIATVISKPLKPFEKAKPQLAILVVAAGGTGALASLAWIAFCILRGLPYTDRQQLEQGLGFPVVADWSEKGAIGAPGREAMFLHALGAQRAKAIQISAPGMNGVGQSVATDVARAAARTGARCLLVVVTSQGSNGGNPLEPKFANEGNLLRMEISSEAAVRPEGLASMLVRARNEFDHVFVEAGGCDEPAIVEWLSTLTDQNVVVVGKDGVNKQTVDGCVDHLVRSGMPPLSLMMVDPNAYRGGKGPRRPRGAVSPCATSRNGDEK